SQQFFKLKREINAAEFVRKTFPLSVKHLEEACAAHALHKKVAGKPHSSVASHRAQVDIPVRQFGITVNFHHVEARLRSQEKDQDLLTLIRNFQDFKTKEAIDELIGGIQANYPSIKRDDIQFFYDMELCKTGNIGSQLLSEKCPETKETMIENLAVSAASLLKARAGESKKIVDDSDRRACYMHPFGEKLDSRLSDETLRFLKSCPRLLERADQPLYNDLCSNIHDSLCDIRESIIPFIERYNRVLYPEAIALEGHDDMNLGNLMGDISNGEIVYIDNGASIEELSSINTEMTKLLFAFPHHGHLEALYKMDHSVATMDTDSTNLKDELLALKKVFLTKLEQYIPQEVKDKSPHLLLQANFFSVVQHISDTGFVIQKQIAQTIEALSQAEPNEEKQKLQENLKKLIDRCFMNIQVYQEQIEGCKEMVEQTQAQLQSVDP
ncbi:hypothetical protein HOH45_08840, partial [bacterium]|nr:hypothetical protein [bacterium]